MTSHESLLALRGIAIETAEFQDGHLTIQARSQQQTADCPDCGSPSSRVHSDYTRQPADVASANWPARLALRVYVSTKSRLFRN